MAAQYYRVFFILATLCARSLMSCLEDENCKAYDRFLAS